PGMTPRGPGPEGPAPEKTPPCGRRRPAAWAPSRPTRDWGRKELRIIGGRCRGMRLVSVPGTTTRPTADRVREALFNILAPWVPGARVLDLYAGTGALGIEALSRGAQEAVFVERQPRVVQVLRANLRHTGLAPLARVRVGDAAREIIRLARHGERFDLVFMDPPYGRGLARDTLLTLGGTHLVAPGGWVV